MKRRIVTIAVSFLLCIGMIGAGFAAWVITGNTQDDASGNIEVKEVVDNRIILSHDWKDADATITYGPKAGTYTYNWLTHDASDPAESLSVTLVVTLENYANLKSSKDAGTISDISIAFAWDETQMAEYVAARDTDKVVGALPTVNALNLASFADADADGVYTAEVTFTFAWGEAFNFVNPMEFYNNQEFSNALADEASANLTKLYALNAAGFVLDLNASIINPNN